MNSKELNSIWLPLNEQLLNFTHKRVKDRNLAQDIVQNVYLKVADNINRLKDSDKVIPWIFQITRNTIIDHFRNSKKELHSDMQTEIEEEIMEEETQNLARCILPMIDTLPQKYKEAVRLSEIEGVSQTELAERLGISYSGAKSRVQRGREKLKEVLQQCCTIRTDQYGNVIEYTEKRCSEDCN